MDDAQLDRLIDEYIIYTIWLMDHLHSQVEPPSSFDLFTFETAFESDELLWRFIIRACDRELPDATVSSLAAGPLEELIASRGRYYIGRIERLAYENSRFNQLLGGVWENEIAPDIWERVQKARNHKW